MAVKTNAELDAYFNTGDQPSESNFNDLIDTIQPPHVLLTDADTSLTIADHAFRTVIIPDVSAPRTYTLPSTFTADGAWFHFLYFGDLSGDDGHNVIFKTGTQNSQFFHGCIIHNSTANDSSGGALNAADQADGSSHDILTFTTNAAFDIWFHAKSTTVWYVWGNSVSGGIDEVAFSAS